MSLDENKVENAVEDISVEEQIQEVSEELVDEEQSQVIDGEEEALEEKATAKSESEHEDEEDEEEEEEHEEVKEIQIPKTKAGVIQAAVEMLKTAKKEDAQKLFAKMAKVDETSEEESIASVDAAAGAVKKKNELKAKAKVESVDFEEDLEAIITEEATLSDGFREKASSIFEAVLTSKLAQEVDRLEAEYAQNLEEEVSEIQSGMVEKVDSYLNYVVEQWMKDNEVAVTTGLRTEIAEDFMTSLQSVFKEHYIEVPEGKENMIDELADQVSELEESLNKSTEDNIRLHEAVQSFERAEVIRSASLGLAETEAEKLNSLVEGLEYDDKESFEMKVGTIRESYFGKGKVEAADEVNSLAGEDTAPVDVSDTMAMYTQAISKFNK